MQNEAWVRIYSDVYDDNIVGNKEGLLQLRIAIDSAIQTGNATCTDIKTDFESIICSADTWEDEENLEGSDSILGLSPAFFLFLWGVLLPLVGVLAVSKWVIITFIDWFAY